MHLGVFCEASAPDTRARAARRAERGERPRSCMQTTSQPFAPACRESFVDSKQKNVISSKPYIRF